MSHFRGYVCFTSLPAPVPTSSAATKPSSSRMLCSKSNRSARSRTLACPALFSEDAMSTKVAAPLAGGRIKTELPGPNARRIVAEDNKWISPSYTRSYPMVAKRGRGVVVEDVDGNEFLDFSSGIAVVSTGHCHPEVVAAIQKQAGELIHMSGTDFYYESMITLAERLQKIAPMRGPHRIYYGNSGTEAVEAALKLARYHTKRQHVIAFYGAFHGRTMGALSLTASKPQQRRRFAPLVPGVTHIPYPNVYR